MEGDNNMNTQDVYEEEISLVDIVKFFIRHSKTIVLTTVICILAGIFGSIILGSKKIYKAESALIVLGTKSDVMVESKTGVLGIKEIADIYPPRLEDRKRTIVELIKSPLIISDVISKARKEKIFVDEDKFLSVEDFISPKSKIIEIKQTGEIIKIIVRMEKKELAKFFADEIAKSVVNFAREKLYIDLPEQQKEKLIKIAYLSILPKKPEPTTSKKVSIAVALVAGIIIGIFIGLIKEAYIKVKQEI